jgi:glycosyltransferase involved in cell wall biosynthesis
MLKVLVVKGANPSHFYRCHLPFQFLADRGRAVVDFRYPKIRSLDEGWDLVVMFEAYSAESHEFLMQARRRKIPIFYDIDDYTFEIPASYGGFELFYERGKGAPTARLIWLARNLRAADVVVCSTSALARRLAPLSSSVVVVENGVDYEAWASAHPTECSALDGKLVIGWHGSYNHWDDLTVVVEPMTAFLASNGAARWVIVGMPEFIQRIPRALRPQVILYPFTENMSAVRSVVARFDVALAPAAALEFNACKSDLRVLQYGAAGVAVVGSSVPYGETLADGRGIVVDRSSAWLDGIESLSGSASKRLAYATDLRMHVLLHRTVEHAAKAWAELITETLTASPLSGRIL